MKISSKKKGFVLLYTVLISSIILAITIGITMVAYQEVVLSASAKEGNISFYAADTGAECALYADINLQVFDDTPNSFSCAGNSVAAGVFSFDLNLNLVNGAYTNCAKVKVEKNATLAGGLVGTRIESLGYNVSCDMIANNPNNPKIVERAIRVTYGEPSIVTPPPTPTPPPSSPGEAL